MRSIAFLSQKGGVGRTTLAASLAAAAAGAGERVIALDLDPQASLVSWGERRKAASTPNKLVIEPFEGERLPLLHAILEGLAEAGFTIAVFDTAANSASARLVAPAADICLLPTRPTRLDVDVAAATFRAACLAERKAALLLNQCPPTYPSLRTRRSRTGVNALRSFSHADTVRAHGFSGCHCDRLGGYRIRVRRQGSTGNRGALGLDTRAVGKHPK